MAAIKTKAIKPSATLIPNLWNDNELWNDDELWQDFLEGGIPGMNCDLYDMLVDLAGQISIDETIISPKLGVNVKLTDSTNPDRFFTAVVSNLTARIRNYNTGVFTALVLDGVNHVGEKRIITITIENIQAGVYGDFDTMHFTTNLTDTNPVVTLVTPTNIINSNRTVRVFDNTWVQVTRLISYKLDDGRYFRGQIASIPLQGEIRLMINSVGAGQQTLTLEQVTHPNFQGWIHDVVFSPIP